MKHAGIDVGTSTIILATDSGKYIKIRNCFIDLPMTTIIENTLTTMSQDYVKDTERNKIYLIGDAALSFANMFGRDVRRPMFKGVISNKDSDAIPIMREIFKLILEKGEVDKDTIINYTIPSAPINDSFDIEYHKSVIESILNDLGYTKINAVNEALCVAYSELEKQQYSGISVSLGAGMINVCVSQFGLEALSYSVQGSGDAIDEKVAKSQPRMTASKITAIKEAGIDIFEPKNNIETAISVYYKALIKNFLKFTLDTMTATEGIVLKDDIAIAIAGGTSKVGGFKKLFQETLKELSTNYNFTYGDIILNENEDRQNLIAKGALVSSKLSV